MLDVILSRNKCLDSLKYNFIKEGNMTNLKEYGIKKTLSGYATYANVQDGVFLMPISWASFNFKSKVEALKTINEIAKKHNWNINLRKNLI